MVLVINAVFFPYPLVTSTFNDLAILFCLLPSDVQKIISYHLCLSAFLVGKGLPCMHRKNKSPFRNDCKCHVDLTAWKPMVTSDRGLKYDISG